MLKKKTVKEAAKALSKGSNKTERSLAGAVLEERKEEKKKKKK